MKKCIVLLMMLCGLLPWGSLNAQNVEFEKYFINATLRINYLRVGNRMGDTIVEHEAYFIPTQWSGSLTQLLDPFDNGDYRVVMKSTQGQELYSRCYNSLFREYVDTR